jgi:hypothetical protein
MLRSGKEHLESLCDSRVVYIGNEKVDDVTTHPALRNTAQTVVALYDMKARRAKKRQGRALGPSSLYRKCTALVLVADLHARADPSVAVPNRPAVGPVALRRRSGQSRHQQRQDAKRAWASTVVAMMVMVVMMMVVVLRDLSIARRILAHPLVIGFQQSKRVRDRFEKVAVTGYGLSAGCRGGGGLSAAYGRQSRRRAKQSGYLLIHGDLPRA